MHQVSILISNGFDEWNHSQSNFNDYDNWIFKNKQMSCNIATVDPSVNFFFQITRVFFRFVWKRIRNFCKKQIQWITLSVELTSLTIFFHKRAWNGRTIKDINSSIVSTRNRCTLWSFKLDVTTCSCRCIRIWAYFLRSFNINYQN